MKTTTYLNKDCRDDKMTTRNVPSYDDYGMTSDQKVTKLISLRHLFGNQLNLVTLINDRHKICLKASRMVYCENICHVIISNLLMS